jgi:hypothetical protein
MSTTFEETMLRTRPPTEAEAQMAGREFPSGDEVLVIGDEANPDWGALGVLAFIFEYFGTCDAAHVVPAGVYLEE